MNQLSLIEKHSDGVLLFETGPSAQSSPWFLPTPKAGTISDYRDHWLILCDKMDEEEESVGQYVRPLLDTLKFQEGYYAQIEINYMRSIARIYQIFDSKFVIPIVRNLTTNWKYVRSVTGIVVPMDIGIIHAEIMPELCHWHVGDGDIPFDDLRLAYDEFSLLKLA